MNEKINNENIINLKQIQPTLCDFQSRLKLKLQAERN